MDTIATLNAVFFIAFLGFIAWGIFNLPSKRPQNFETKQEGHKTLMTGPSGTGKTTQAIELADSYWKEGYGFFMITPKAHDVAKAFNRLTFYQNASKSQTMDSFVSRALEVGPNQAEFEYLLNRLTALLEKCKAEHHKVVVLFDDANTIAPEPGQIDKIKSLIENYPAKLILVP